MRRADDEERVARISVRHGVRLGARRRPGGTNLVAPALAPKRIDLDHKGVHAALSNTPTPYGAVGQADDIREALPIDCDGIRRVKSGGITELEDPLRVRRPVCQLHDVGVAAPRCGPSRRRHDRERPQVTHCLSDDDGGPQGGAEARRDARNTTGFVLSARTHLPSADARAGVRELRDEDVRRPRSVDRADPDGDVAQHPRRRTGDVKPALRWADGTRAACQRICVVNSPRRAELLTSHNRPVHAGEHLAEGNVAHKRPRASSRPGKARDDEADALVVHHRRGVVRLRVSELPHPHHLRRRALRPRSSQ